jgi:hypothetical protein
MKDERGMAEGNRKNVRGKVKVEKWDWLEGWRGVA